MPATRFRAQIGDVDGDGRPDTEWAVLLDGGTIEFGVTTAAGATIETKAEFASGGSRSVSIGTLSTGQTVALPTDRHSALLYVLHDCRWIAPSAPGRTTAFQFATGYGGLEHGELGADGACVDRRLYQVWTRYPDPAGSPDGERVRISPNDRTVAVDPRWVTLASFETDRTLGPSDRCLPSAILSPIITR